MLALFVTFSVVLQSNHLCLFFVMPCFTQGEGVGLPEEDMGKFGDDGRFYVHFLYGSSCNWQISQLILQGLSFTDLPSQNKSLLLSYCTLLQIS
jgi:hypothetical protein